MWSVRIEIAGRLERITYDTCARWASTAEDLVSDDYGGCQEVAGAARADGVEALVVPSAALPGTENLVVLGPRAAVSWLTPPIDPARDVPSGVAADRAGPALAMLPLVRWRGADHHGYGEWRAGRGYRLTGEVPTDL